MDPNVQGSFIPKQALTAQARGSSIGLFLLLALLIFVMSIVAAGAAFGYEYLLNGTITKKDGELRSAEGAFDPAAIQDLMRLDMRLQQAQALLSSHVSPSAVFSFLSTVTLERVQFNSFDLTVSKDGAPALTLSGTADSFSTVALQSDQFGSSKVLRDVIFSGITVNEGGKVAFTVNTTIDPNLILYSNSLKQADAQ